MSNKPTPSDNQGRGGRRRNRPSTASKRPKRANVSQSQAFTPDNETPQSNMSNNQASQTTVNTDYQLLLQPMFAAMTRITDHLFLTGIGGMTRENFRKNHIDFVVNITTEAPFWEDIESMRLPLEDDTSTNILPYMDMAVTRINEVIVKRNAHVLVHCIAGVSRSATIVIAYLMKYRKMDLRSAFNYCYELRPVIRPNNGFMRQLILYESQLFGKSSVYMVEADVDGLTVHVPHFFIEEHPRLVLLEHMRIKDQLQRALANKSAPLPLAPKGTFGKDNHQDD